VSGDLISTFCVEYKQIYQLSIARPIVIRSTNKIDTFESNMLEYWTIRNFHY